MARPDTGGRPGWIRDVELPHSLDELRGRTAGVVPRSSGVVPAHARATGLGAAGSIRPRGLMLLDLFGYARFLVALRSFSRLQPVDWAAAGIDKEHVRTIDAAVKEWRIELEGRQRGAPQKSTAAVQPHRGR